jgi:hypothetical protein
MFGALLAVAVLAGGWATSASAAIIKYRLGGTASGTFDGTPFTDMNVATVAVADTSTLTSYMGVAQVVFLTSADLATQGHASQPLAVGPGTFFALGTGSNGNLAAFGHGGLASPQIDILMSSPGFVGWNGVSPLGTIKIDVQFTSPYPVSLTLANGKTVLFSAFNNPTFSASAPEPASWAMLLMGCVGMGGLLRLRRTAQVNA